MVHKLLEAEATLLDGLVTNELLNAFFFGIVGDRLVSDVLISAHFLATFDCPLVVICTRLSGEELVVPALGIDRIVRLSPSGVEVRRALLCGPGVLVLLFDSSLLFF